MKSRLEQMFLGNIGIGVVSILLAVLSTSSAYSANFNCKSATTAVERMVCGDQRISELDDRMANVYAKTLIVVIDKDAVTKSQKRWIKQVRNRCKNDSCLIASYTDRLAELQSLLSSNLNNKTISTSSFGGEWEPCGKAFYGTGSIKITSAVVIHKACKTKFIIFENRSNLLNSEAVNKNSCYAFSDKEAVNYIKIIRDGSDVTIRYYSTTNERSLLGEGTYSRVE